MSALTTEEVLVRVLATLNDFPDFNLDDALWCYVYEPRSSDARHLVGSAIGARNKHDLIAWCDDHDQAEQRAVVERILPQFDGYPATGGAS